MTGALIGERWRIGSAELEVTQPRQPCWKLGVRLEDTKMPHRFSEANRPGAYLAVVKAGDLRTGAPSRSSIVRPTRSPSACSPT